MTRAAGSGWMLVVVLGLIILGVFVAIGISRDHAVAQRAERARWVAQHCAEAGFTPPQCALLFALDERAQTAKENDEAYQLIIDSAATAH
jgi:hypothetical protein